MPDPRTHVAGSPEDLALAVHLEPLVGRGRVLWVGPNPTPPWVLARAASRIRVLVPEGVPLPPPDRDGPRVGHLRPDGPAFRSGSFDLVVVPDLDAVGLAHARGVEQLRRGLTDDGLLVLGLAVGEDADASWERLVELADAERDDVRLFGQTRISAMTLAELDASSPTDGVVFDGSLVDVIDPDGDAAERYVAVCGVAGERLDGLIVVQTPDAAARAAGRGKGADRRGSEERDDGEPGALEVLAEHAEALERALDEARAEARAARSEAEEARRAEREARAASRAPDDEDESFARLERALAERARVVMELQSEVRRRGALVRDAVERFRSRAHDEARAGAARLDAAAAQAPLASTTPAADALRAERDAAVERALDAELARTEAQYRIDELEAALASAGVPPESVRRPEIARADAELEGRARGLARRVAELEAAQAEVPERSRRLEAALADMEARAHAAERELAAMRLEHAQAVSRADAERRRREAAMEALEEARAVLTGLNDSAPHR